MKVKLNTFTLLVIIAVVLTVLVAIQTLQVISLIQVGYATGAAAATTNIAQVGGC